jgi:biofilm PGA synthesis N-glycosyltransferase PgaC
MKGWKTRTFPEKICRHNRGFSRAEHGELAARFKHGIREYAVGNHPVWELFRMFYQMTKRPYIIGGLVLASGYFWALIRRVERPVSNELIAFYRREQMRRLKSFFLRSGIQDDRTSEPST